MTQDKLFQAQPIQDVQLCVHPDFEAKATEILNWNISSGSEGELSALKSAISTALRDAYERGRTGVYWATPVGGRSERRSQITDAEIAAELGRALAWILSDKKMRHPKSNRDEAIIQTCEAALALSRGPDEEPPVGGDTAEPRGESEPDTSIRARGDAK